MTGPMSGGGGFGDFLHHHLLKLIVAAYLLAAVCPAAGLAVKACDLGRLAPDIGIALPLPGLLLAGLLFNAGLAVESGELVGVVRRPWLVLAGLLANLLLPLGFVALVAAGLGGWHDPGEAACLVAGLALVAAMPIAGSSTAWSQAADGNVALSLGLVVGSTLLSPVTTPLVLDTARVTAGDGVGAVVAAMTGHPAGDFLATFVVLPTAAGMAARLLAGRDRVRRLKPASRAAGSLVVLVLCYVNASASLPAVVRQPDWDFLVLTVGAAFALCGTGFAAGWAVARCLGAGRSERASLMFGLGMSNNGTGLVLAAACAVPAEATLLVLVYNLAQHVVAGVVGRTPEMSQTLSPAHDRLTRTEYPFLTAARRRTHGE